jgi:PucR family transcriptional regulator, purine catabolism regulatory protein
MSDNPQAVPPPRHDPATAGPLTLADALALPVLAAGQPRIVTGQDRLERPVRWVHITELTDPASFLKGGELVLTTGMPLPEEPAKVRRYVDELADVQAAALVIELVRRYHRPPEALVRACRDRGLPLITLSKDVNFVEVTQVVHALVLGSQTEAMRRTQRVHEAFTALTLRGAGPQEVVRAAAEMSGHTVVLENLVHQALICEPSGLPVEDALTDWERRSRSAPPPEHAGLSGPEGWLTAPVEYQGERWGRLIMLPPPSPRRAPVYGQQEVTVLERAAMTLTIARLIHSTAVERTAHRDTLRDLAGQRHRSPAEARARAAALGLPSGQGRFLAVLVDTRTDTGSGEFEGRLHQELTAAFGPALVGALSPRRVGVLLCVGPSTAWRPAVEQLSRTARLLDPEADISVGSEVTDLSNAARSFREAAQVAESALPSPAGSAGKFFRELSDIGLRELLYALRSDVRLQGYVERQLGRLIDHDTRHGTDLLPTLRHYLDAAGNKTLAARHGDLSRQTLYHRLRTVERLLDCDLDDGGHRTRLHVALTALEVMRLR